LWLAARGHSDVALFTFYDHELAGRLPYRHLKRAVQGIAGPRAEVSYFTGRFLWKEMFAPPKLARLKAGIPGLYKKVHSFRFCDPAKKLIGHARQVIEDDARTAAMYPLCEQALAQTRATAWVCDDGATAQCALDYLKEHGRSVPRDISLLSMVDSEEACAHGVTAYDFERDRMGYLAAHAILGDIPVRRDRAGYLPNPGRIIDRGSVGRGENAEC